MSNPLFKEEPIEQPVQPIVLNSQLADAGALQEKVTKTVSIMAIGGLLGGLYSMYFHQSILLGIGVGAGSFYILSKFVVKN